MADDADRSDDKIFATEQIGVEAARRALQNPALLPIGACHYCGSWVAPRHLYCPVDEIEPEQSCSVQHEIELRLKKQNGRM